MYTPHKTLAIAKIGSKFRYSKTVVSLMVVLCVIIFVLTPETLDGCYMLNIEVLSSETRQIQNMYGLGCHSSCNSNGSLDFREKILSSQVF